MLLDEVREAVLVDAAEEIQHRVAHAHMRGAVLDECDRAAQAMREACTEQAGQVETRIDDVEIGVLGLDRRHRLLEALVAFEEGIALLEEALGGQSVDAQAVLVFETRQGLVVQRRDDEYVVAQGAQLLAEAILVALDPTQVGQEELHEDADLDGGVGAISH